LSCPPAVHYLYTVHCVPYYFSVDVIQFQIEKRGNSLQLFLGLFRQIGRKFEKEKNKGAQHWAAIWKLPLRDDCWYNDNSPIP
jgi:hypothetical protein